MIEDQSKHVLHKLYQSSSWFVIVIIYNLRLMQQNKLFSGERILQIGEVALQITSQKHTNQQTFCLLPQ